MAPDALERLKRLVEGKATLIRKALDADSLAITLTDKLNFPWWNHMPDEVAAYMAFLAALCRMAQNAKRVNVKDKPVESEKYLSAEKMIMVTGIGAVRVIGKTGTQIRIATTAASGKIGSRRL